MAPVTMKDDALPQIHLVRDTDLGVFAYELHILAGDFLRESEFNLRSLATNTGPDSIAIMGKNHIWLADALSAYYPTGELYRMAAMTEYPGARAFLFHTERKEDGRLYGDVLMTEDVLAGAMVPFVFDMADDLKSKEIVAGLSCDAYIFCHKGIRYGSVAELAQMNIRHIQGQLAACGALVTEPMTYSRFYAAVVTAMDLPVGHPARGLHLERYIRPYLEYLVDRGDLTLIEQNGAPAVAPKEARHGR